MIFFFKNASIMNPFIAFEPKMLVFKKKKLDQFCLKGKVEFLFSVFIAHSLLFKLASCG